MTGMCAGQTQKSKSRFLHNVVGVTWTELYTLADGQGHHHAL